MKINKMKLDLADILCIKCLLLIGCYPAYGSGPEDILKSDHKHRTHKAAERANELWCYQCFTMDINKDYCMNVSKNESSIQRKCDNDLRTCMVKRVSYTTTANSTASTAVHKIWSLERNCTQKCESGCIIIGERLKLYKCTSCCEGKSFCNRGNEGSINFESSLLLLFICQMIFLL